MEDGEFLNGSADGDDELSLVIEATTTVHEQQQQGTKRARDEEEDELVMEYDIAEAISRNEAEAVETAATPSDAKRAKITPMEEYDIARTEISVGAPHVESVLDLPPEVMLKIFVYLGFVDLANCALVCHQWKAVSSDDALWKRMYYEVWGTNAKTWKQLFASHYPDHEQIDMQQLIQAMTKPRGSRSRRNIMGLYRLDKSHDGQIDNLEYPTLYRDVWALSSVDLKRIVANEVGLTARADPLCFELSITMQRFGGTSSWKEITSYDRAQTILWEMLRYEGNSETKTWMSEDEANSCTEWLFGYFPYKAMGDQQLRAIMASKALEKAAWQARHGQQDEQEQEEQEEVGEEEEESEAVVRMPGAGVVGVGERVRASQTIHYQLIGGELIRDDVDDDEEEEHGYAMESLAPATTTSTSTTTTSTTTTTANNDNAVLEEEVLVVDENNNSAPPPSAPAPEAEGKTLTEDVHVVEMEPIQVSEVIIHEGQPNVSGANNDSFKEEIILEEDEEVQPECAPMAEEIVVIEEAEPAVGEELAQQPPEPTLNEPSEGAVRPEESVTTEATNAIATDAPAAEAEPPKPNTEAAEGEQEIAPEPRGRSQVARFLHTGSFKVADDGTFVYGFAAISSSRFCTYWLVAEDTDESTFAFAF